MEIPTNSPPEEDFSPKTSQIYEPMGKPSGKFGPGLWIILGLSLIALVCVFFLFATVLPNTISAFAGVDRYTPEPQPDIQAPAAVEHEDLSPEEWNRGLIESCEDIIASANENIEVYQEMGATEHVEAWQTVADLWAETMEACRTTDDLDIIEPLGDQAIQALEDAMALPMPS